MTTNNYASQIVARLQSDTVASPIYSGTPLETLLPGGIILIQEPGRKGLNRVKYEAGFNAQTGLIKPLAVILELKEQATGEAIDTLTGYNSTRTTELLWLYAQGDRDETGQDPFVDVLEPAWDRIYHLLQGFRLTSGFQVLWRGDVQRDKHEPDLNDAAYYVAAFNAFGYRKFS